MYYNYIDWGQIPYNSYTLKAYTTPAKAYLNKIRHTKVSSAMNNNKKLAQKQTIL